MNASLDEKLRNVKWGEFKITQLFKPMTVKRKIKGEDVSEKGIYPAYSSDIENNGIVGYYSKPEFICDSNNPVYVVFGDHTKAMNIARNSFSVLDNVKVLRPYYESTNVLLFVFSIWKKQIPNMGYKRHWGIAKECLLRLPTKNGTIDFAFMESFIAELEAERVQELEAERVQELEAYLKASGFDNYELSQEEENAIKAVDTVNWGEFLLGDLFEVVSYRKRFDSNKVTIVENGGHPYIVRQSTKNGKKGNIAEPVEYLNPGNTISFGQDTATMFYQEKPYFTGDKIKILKPKCAEFSKDNAQFFLSAMTKVFSTFAWGASMFNVEILKKQIVLLPIKNDGSIDFNFMETLISAIQKLVVKDVVKYADSKISATKEVISK